MLKPILQIPIDDTKLKAAADHVKRMQEMAAKMPAAWKSVEEATKGTGKASQAIVTAMMAQTSILKDAIEDQHKLTLESDKTAASWRKIETSAKESAKSTHGIIRSVSNWVSGIFRGGGSLLSAVGAEAGIGGLAGLLGGAVIGAGIYGMQRIGQTVGDYRRYAMGVGSTIGQTRAFGLDFGRFINPQQFLGSATEAAYDVTSPAYRALAVAGVSPQTIQGGNAADISKALLGRLPGMLGTIPHGAWGSILRATGLDQFVSLQDAVRFMGAGEKERGQMMAAYGKDQGPLGIADKTAKKWVDMTNRLEVAEGGALSAFASGLANAAAGLGNAAQAAVNAAMALNGMTSALGGHPAALVAAPIVSAITGKNVTGADVAGQMRMTGDRAADLRRQRQTGQATWYGQLGGLLLTGSANAAYHNPGNLKLPGGTSGFVRFPSDEAGVRAVAHQLMLYETRDHIDTISGIINKYAPSNENDPAAYIRDVSRWTGFGAGQHLNLSDSATLAKLVSAITRQEGVKYFTPQQVQVAISKSTGSDVNVSVSQLGPGGAAATP